VVNKNWDGDSDENTMRMENISHLTFAIIRKNVRQTS